MSWRRRVWVRGFYSGYGVEPRLFGSVASLPLEEQRVALRFIVGAAGLLNVGDLAVVVDLGPCGVELGFGWLWRVAEPGKAVVGVAVQRPFGIGIVGGQYGGVVGHADTSNRVIVDTVLIRELASVSSSARFR